MHFESAKPLTTIGIHIGHKARKWNARNAAYLLFCKDNIHIIDIEQTLPMMRRALSFVNKVSEKRGKISFAKEHIGVRDKEEKKFIPQALFLMSTKSPEGALLVRRAIKLCICIVAIVDSDANAFAIQYPVPANDEKHVYKEFILGAIVEAYERELTILQDSLRS